MKLSISSRFGGVTDRLYSIDALTGISAIVIAFFHHSFYLADYAYLLDAYFIPKMLEPLVLLICQRGPLAVDLFFMLSGFILYRMYKEKVASGRIELQEYCLLRFSRLYPLYWLTLAVVACWYVVAAVNGLVAELVPEILNPAGTNLYTLTESVFMIQGMLANPFAFNSPSWTLSYTVAGYLLFFLIARLSGGKNGLAVFVIPILTGVVSAQFEWSRIPLVTGNGTRLLICFFVGCFVFEIYKWGSAPARRLWISVISAIIAVSFPYLSLQTFAAALFGNYNMVIMVLYFPALILLVLMVAPVKKFLSLAPFRWLGNLSFSIFLWHYPVVLTLKLVLRLTRSPWEYSARRCYFIWVAGTLIISHLSHYLFELPMQKIIRAKYYEWRNRKNENGRTGLGNTP